MKLKCLILLVILNFLSACNSDQSNNSGSNIEIQSKMTVKEAQIADSIEENLNSKRARYNYQIIAEILFKNDLEINSFLSLCKKDLNSYTMLRKSCENLRRKI